MTFWFSAMAASDSAMAASAISKASSAVRGSTVLPDSGLTELADHSSPTAASGTSVATPAVAYIVGSIAQTISYSSVLTTAQKSFLLSNSAVVSGVTVEKALADFVAGRFSGAVAVSYRKMVADAFADVRAAGLGNLVAGDRKIGAGGVKEADSVLTGKYEVGSVNDPETQYTNR
jgi:hypothetical protein